MEVIFSEPNPIPHHRRPPGLPPPKYKMLAIGINYIDGSGPGDSSLRLQGAVSDATNMVATFKGACVRLERRPAHWGFLTRLNFAAADLYHVREQDIFLMTDEEINRNTLKWPSAQNIVRLLAQGIRGCIPHVLTTLCICSCRQSTILSAVHLPGMSSCFIVC